LLILMLFGWTSLVGVVRAEFLRARNFDYVRAARALGMTDGRIMFKHVLPNAMVATLTFMPFILSGSIVALTALDFLGLGLPPGSASLGDLLRQGKDNLQAPWLGIAGFVVLALLLSLLVFVGEAVRDAFDPRKNASGTIRGAGEAHSRPPTAILRATGTDCRFAPGRSFTPRIGSSRRDFSTYEDLAAPQWRDKICVRSSDSIYNQSLVAGMISHHGEAKTEAWAKGLVANFARPPKGGDRDQIKAVAAGECDVTLANTYYLGGMVNSPDPAEQAAAAKVAVFWPDAKTTGVHVNVSGAGVTAHARNRDNALKLLEFLASDSAQRWYAETSTTSIRSIRPFRPAPPSNPGARSRPTP
jgi:hypothetical protein